MTNHSNHVILIPFSHDTPGQNINPTKQTDAAANGTTGTQNHKPPHLQESSEPSRYFAAEREDFNATLLEYTQYRLPHERNEPARDSTAEISAPHEHPQESSEPQYFAAEREGWGIDFTAPCESLLDYTL